MSQTYSQIKMVVGGEEINIPEVLTQDKELLQSVLSMESLEEALTNEDKEKLLPLLPSNPSLSLEDGLKTLSSSEELRFGTNPLSIMWEKLSRGYFSPDTYREQLELKQLLHKQYKLGQAHYFVKLLQELLVARQEVLQKALFAGSLENMWKGGGRELKMGGEEKKEQRRKTDADEEYEKVLKELGCSDGVLDEAAPDMLPNQGMEESVLSILEYRRLLRQHRKHRELHQVSYLSMAKCADRSYLVTDYLPTTIKKRHHHHHHRMEEEGGAAAVPSFQSRKQAKLEQEVCVVKKDIGGGTRRGRKMMQERCQHERTTAAQAKDIYRVYISIDKGTLPEPKLEPILLVNPPTCKSLSYFSLLKAVFEPLNDKKAELAKISKNVVLLMKSPECSDCSWLSQRSDWVDLTLSALCYLAAEVGATSSFSPMPHFVPLIEFRDRIDHWKWIGTGRDSEFEMLILCENWLDNLDKTLPVVDYSDYEPLPPHLWTNCSFSRSSPEELVQFRTMERERYASPHKAYVYNMRGYESPVGPVKGARVTKKESGSKARGHALLVPNRPTCVTILSLVRDATSRLPNGEGTRLDLCIQVQDSQYIAESVSEIQLNNAVSGALDRLHYEKDPCVRYDGTRKVWIYLHRGRNEEDFERIHWACEVAAKQRKMLLAKPKSKLEIILRVEGKDKILEVGSNQIAEEEVGKIGRRTSGRSTSAAIATSSSSALSGGQVGSSVSLETPPQGMVTPSTPHSLPQPAQLSLVVASVVHGGSGIMHDEDEEDMTMGGFVPSLQAPTQDLTVGGVEKRSMQKANSRKRKQSLKMAELLQEGARSNLGHSSSSASSSWSSDNEGPAPSPRQSLQSDAMMDTSMGSVVDGKKEENENDWSSSPEGVSPDTSFDDY